MNPFINPYPVDIHTPTCDNIYNLWNLQDLSSYVALQEYRALYLYYYLQKPGLHPPDKA
jgi:hypothetical protein